MNLWVFDNDGTLYDDREVCKEFFKLLYEYFGRLLNIPSKQVQDKTQELRKKWDTEFVFEALVKESGVDFATAVKNVHLKIDLASCGIPTPDTLRHQVISNLAGKKVVLTNNPSAFARNVLSYVGLLEQFSDIIGMEEMGFHKKANPLSFQGVEKRHQGAERIIFCDDLLENLDEARRQGWVTIWHKPIDMDKRLGENHIVISSFEEFTDAVSPFT